MLIHENIFRDIARLIIWYPFRWIIGFLPFKWSFFILSKLGVIHAFLSSKKVLIIKKNMSNAFAGILNDNNFFHEEAVKCLQNYYVNQLHIFLYPIMRGGGIRKIHKFEGLHNLENALSKHKGCIIIHPHYGPAQITLFALGDAGYKTFQIGLPTEEGLNVVGRKICFKLRLQYEAKIPAAIVRADKFLRPIFRALNGGGVVMVPGDGVGRGRFIGKGINARLLSYQNLYPAGPISLAKRTGSAVCPAFIIEEKIGSYKTIIHEPLNIDYYSDDKNVTIEELKQFINLFELYLKKKPGHWLFWDEFESKEI